MDGGYQSCHIDYFCAAHVPAACGGSPGCLFGVCASECRGRLGFLVVTSGYVWVCFGQAAITKAMSRICFSACV
jgi:hypothetical protein